MSKGEDKTTEGEPVVPMSDFDAPSALEVLEEGSPEQLGFDLRFEGGAALLALENCTFIEGVVVRTALFEVPDVTFPLDLSGGAERFIDKRLRLRAADVTLDFDALFRPEALAQVGVELKRHRSRSGGIELMCAIDGPTDKVRVRARGAFVPAGKSGLAVVLHEVVPFGVSHRPRFDVAQALLSAIELPGGRPARGLVRRADVLRALFSTLLPSYGWKVPAVDGVRVHEAQLGRGHLSMRAYRGDKPEGWKRIRTPKRAAMQSAVVLAGMADDLAGKDLSGRLSVVDAMVDAGLVPAAVPFAAEIIRQDERRHREADDVVKAGYASAPEHLGVLSARVEEADLSPEERAGRLSELGRAAEEQDEAWVSAEAHLAAARLYGSGEDAVTAAGAAFSADPTLGEAGFLYTEQLIARGRDKEALKVAKTVLGRVSDDEREQLCVRLAPVAHRAEGASAAKTLLRRALRKTDRPDALFALVRLHIAEGELPAAAELMARLLAAQGDGASDEERVEFHLLSAELSEATGDRGAARSALAQARRIIPDNTAIGVSLAELFAKDGDLDAAVNTLAPMLDSDPMERKVAMCATHIYLKRLDDGDAKAARALLMRVPADEHDAESERLLAVAEAKDGEPDALARLYLADADAASSPAERARNLLDAAELFLDADGDARAPETAATLALAVRADTAAFAGTAKLLARVADVEFVGELASLLADEPEILRGLSAESDAHPAVAHRLLVPSSAPDDALRRAELANRLGDETLVLSEIDIALSLLAGDEVRTESARDLFTQKGDLLQGRDATQAAAAYERAHALGASVADAWLQTALQAGDVQRVAAAVVATGAELGQLSSTVLRDLVNSGALEDQAALRDAHRTLADRQEERGDADAYLQHLEDAAASDRAEELERLSVMYADADWYLAALAHFERRGEGDEFLERAMPILADEALAPIAIARPVFELAVRQKNTDRVVDAGAVWCRVAGGDRDMLGEALRARYEALQSLDETRVAMALDAWLAAFPAATQALVARVPLLLEEGARERALSVLDNGAQAGGDDIAATVADLSAAVAADANENQDAAAEAHALELWLHHGPPQGQARRDRLVRLATLDIAAERVEAGATRLSELLALLDVGERAAPALELARLCDGPLADGRRAARAYEIAIEDDSENVELSIEYAHVLERSEEWLRYAAELQRRSALLESGEERVAVLLALGDVYAERLGRDKDAESAWLNAARTAPASTPPFARLINAARATNNHRLRVRAHLAAAKAHQGGKRAAEMAEEAGALLAGILLKPRLAVAAYRFSAVHSEDPAPAHRALVELYRAIGDAEGALKSAEAYVSLQHGEAHALGLELVADVHQRLLDDAHSAAQVRRAALVENPKQRTSALALERYLQAEGHIREALDVRRKLADAAEPPDIRAQTYAYLTQIAADKLEEPELAVELAEAALADNPRLHTLRQRRIALLRELNRFDDAVAEMDTLTASDDLSDEETIRLMRQKAQAEETDLDDLAQARRTLREAYRRFPRSDVVVDDLANVEMRLGEPAYAAAALTTILDVYEDGTETLGGRRQVLERIAALLEDADDRVGSLAVLDEAAPLGRLSRASEYRRARLAEHREEFGTAVASLTTLLEDDTTNAEDRVALLGRLGLAAERAERLDVALSAWVRRAERVPNDTDAWRNAERLALALGDLETGRRAADALLHQEDGSSEAQLNRLLWVARDTWRRQDNAAAAAPFFAQARAVLDEEGLRLEHLNCLRAASDRTGAKALIAEREAAGDVLNADEYLYRAQVNLPVDDEPQDGAFDSSLDDVLKAIRLDGVPDPALVEQLAKGAPTLVASALLTEDLDPVRLYAFADALDVDAVEPDVLSELADTFAARPQFALAAIEKERDRDPVRAADRLIALADVERSAEHLHDAASLLLMAEVDVSALLGRLERLGEQWGEDDDLRKEALRRFRDAEAWPAVVTVLEHAIETHEGTTRRALRLETVAVLKSGLEDHQRAAEHLRILLDEDEEDRAAWGEYLETLEELNETTELAAALKRRLMLADGTERRELARRRAEVLLELGEGPDALEDIVAARADADDAGLKGLERAIHAQVGPDALANHLSAELEKEPNVEDAASLFELGARVAPRSRARAGAVLIEHEQATIETVVADTLATDADATARGDALAALAGFLGAAGGGLFSAAAAGLALYSPREAVEVAAALRIAPLENARDLAVDTVARRFLLDGPQPALDEVALWSLADDVANALKFRLHLRRGDIDNASACVEATHPETHAALAAARPDQNRTRDALYAAAAAAARGCADRDAALVAIARAGHAARFELRFERLSPEAKATVAPRVCALVPSAERVEIQLVAQRALSAGERPAFLRRVVEECRRRDDKAAQAHALAVLVTLGDATPDEVFERAELAVLLGEKAATRHALVAVNQAPNKEGLADLLRRAVELSVKRPERDPDIDECLLAWVDAASSSGGSLDDVLAFAQAMRRPRVVNGVLGKKASALDDGPDKAVALQAQADHAASALHDATRAFSLLKDAATHDPDGDYGEQAYLLAAREGLTDALVDVVDDDLARGGLLMLLGEARGAKRVFASLGTLPALYARAELARLDGDVEEERSVLFRIVDDEHAGPESRRRLVELAAIASDTEETVRQALAFLREFYADDRVVEALASALDEAPDDVAGDALEVIREFFTDNAQARSRSGSLLIEAWSRASARVGSEADAILALKALAEGRDDDASWGAYLRRVAQTGETLAFRDGVLRLKTRATLLGEVASQYPENAAVALSALRGDEALALILAASLERAPEATPLRLLQIDNFEALGHHADAARALCALNADDAVGVAANLVRAAGLAETAGDLVLAHACLLSVPLSAFDASVREAALRVAEAAGPAAIPLLVRVASAGGDTPEDVERVLFAATRTTDDVMACAVAGWRLRRSQRDKVARNLAASRGGEQAQRFFGAQLALEGAAPMPVAIDDAFAGAFALKAHEVTITQDPPATDTVLARARFGSAELRRAAWAELADVEGAQERHLDAARFVLRSGASLADAPIDIRLAADPALADLVVRCDVIADELAAAATRTPKERSRLLALFSDLDERGYADAKSRAQVYGDDTGSNATLVDREDLAGDAPIFLAISELHPGAGVAERSTLAALALRRGAREIAAALNPAVAAPAAPRSDGDIVAQLSKRLSDAQHEDSPEHELSVRLLILGASGTDSASEIAIQNLATRLKYDHVLDASLARQIALTDDAQEQGTLYKRRADLLSRRLQKPREALQAMARAVERLPDDHEALTLWVDVAEAHGDLDDRLNAYAAREVTLEGGARERSLLRRADLLSEAGRLTAALSVLGDETPSESEAVLKSRGRVLVALERPVQAAEAYLAAASLGPDVDARAVFYGRAADILYEAGERERAIEALLSAAREGHEASLADAEAKARALRANAALAHVLAVKYDATADVGVRREVALERAQILAGDLDEREKAVGVLEAQAVSDEGDLGARLALAEWYLADRRLLDAALAYESAASIPDLPPIAAAAPAREAASLLSALGDLERAGPLADRALELGVADVKVLAVAAAYHRSHDNHRRVDELLAQELDLVTTIRDKAHLWMERAYLRYHDLSDVDSARKALHRVLELSPDHAGALKMMSAFADESGSYGALRAALSQAAEHSENDAQKIEWLTRIATLDEKQFHDLRAAEASIDKALELSPDDASLLVRKGELMAKRGNVDGLPAILERAEAAGADRLPGMLQLVRGDALLLSGDVAEAKAAFNAATLERDVADKAWDRLIDVIEGEEDPQALAEAVKEARRSADGDDRLASLAKKEAALRRELGDDDGHIGALEAILAAQPGETEALRALRDLYFKKGRLKRVEPLFASWADQPQESDERARRLSEYAAFLLDELGDEAKARAIFEEALALDESEPTALLRLARIAYDTRDFSTALPLLDRVENDAWPRGGTDLDFHRAYAAVKLDAADADDRLRQVLRQDAKHTASLEILASRAMKRGDVPTAEFALHTLSGLIDERDDPLRAAHVNADLARLHIQQSRGEEAKTAALRALELRPAAGDLLELAAEALTLAEDYDRAASVLQRVIAITDDGDAVLAHEKQLLELFERGGRSDKADEIRAVLFAKTHDAAYAPVAAPNLEVDDTLRMPRAPGPATQDDAAQKPDSSIGALLVQADDLIKDRRYIEAVQLLRDRYGDAAPNAELAAVGITAAKGAEDPASLVFFIEERLKGAKNQSEVVELAALAGRTYWKELAKPDRAAELMYLAHQSEPENVDVRLELTSLYAEIPRLFAHAQTGVLQLLRRVPEDSRVFRIGADLASRQKRTQRSRALGTAAFLIDGTNGFNKDMVTEWAVPRAPVTALSEVDRNETLAPDAFNEPMGRLLTVLAPVLENLFPTPRADIEGARRLADVSAPGFAFFEQMDRLLPGRPMRVLIGDVDEISLVPGQLMQVVLPKIAEHLGGDMFFAHIARAVAIVRMGGTLTTLDERRTVPHLFAMLHDAFGDGDRRAAEALLDEATPDMLAQATSYAEDALAGGIDSLRSALDAQRRAADRFALMASASVSGALMAGPIPDTPVLSPAELRERILATPRANELLCFAARDNVWALRVSHELSDEH